MQAPTTGAPGESLFPSDHLDLMRGLAALMVLLWHWRNLYFVDFDPAGATWPARIFYFLTGFGHEAVMVFFVLSGYFIGASVLKAVGAGRWSWKQYLLNRSTRLYVVLIPALVLGACWDSLGMALFGDRTFYSGDLARWGRVIIDFPVAERLTWPVGLGNALFLQDIHVPPFGSNGPLWSLSYEWWYYMLFPLLILLGAPGSLGRKAFQLALLVAIVALVGKKVLAYFAVWLLGAALAYAGFGKRPPIQARPIVRALVLILGIGAFFAAATLSRGHFLPLGLVGDAVVGVGFTACLAAMLATLRPTGSRAYAAIAGSLAGMSYTLYLVHTPWLIFMHGAVGGGRRWPLDAPHLAAALAVLLATLAYAYMVAALTEKHTQRVRELFAGVNRRS